MTQPQQTDDRSMGEWVYCAQHLRPHSTGWCTVSVRDKTPLEAIDREAAYEECRRRGLRIEGE